MPNLPSWVPDYTNGMPWKSLQRSPCKFRATPPSETVFSYEENWPGCLVAPFHQFDTVAAACPAHWDFDEEGTYHKIVDMLSLLLYPEPIRVEGSDSLLKALALTLVADKADDGGTGARDMVMEFATMAFFQLWHVVRAQSPDLVESLPQGEEREHLVVNILTAAGINRNAELVAGPLAQAFDEHRLMAEDDVSAKARGLRNSDAAMSHYTSQSRVPFRVDWMITAGNRSLFRTDRGYLGLGPRTVKVGDRVGILKGAQVPYIFRHSERDAETILDLVGESYVHGIMYGELGSMLEYGRITLY